MGQRSGGGVLRAWTRTGSTLSASVSPLQRSDAKWGKGSSAHEVVAPRPWWKRGPWCLGHTKDPLILPGLGFKSLFLKVSCIFMLISSFLIFPLRQRGTNASPSNVFRTWDSQEGGAMLSAQAGVKGQEWHRLNLNLSIHSPLRRRKLSLETSNSAQKASTQGSRFALWDLCVGSPFQLLKEKENLRIILELEEPWQTWGPHSFYHGRDAGLGRRECPRSRSWSVVDAGLVPMAPLLLCSALCPPWLLDCPVQS